MILNGSDLVLKKIKNNMQQPLPPPHDAIPKILLPPSLPPCTPRYKKDGGSTENR